MTDTSKSLSRKEQHTKSLDSEEGSDLRPPHAGGNGTHAVFQFGLFRCMQYAHTGGAVSDVGSSPSSLVCVAVHPPDHGCSELDLQQTNSTYQPKTN